MNNHIITQFVVAVWATVLARKAGKKGLLDGWLHSFFMLTHLASLLHALVNGNRMPSSAFELNSWYLHSAVYFTVAFCPNDIAYQVATHEWVWPLVCVVAQLDIVRVVQSLMAKSSSAPLFPLFTGFLLMVGPAYIRGDSAAGKKDVTMNAVAFVVPSVVFDVYLGSRHANRDQFQWALRYTQIVACLVSTKFLPFIEDSFQSKLSEAIDAVFNLLPSANDGKKKAKPAAKTSARRAASPATPRSAKKTR